MRLGVALFALAALVWAAALAAQPRPGGGTLRVDLEGDLDHVDPSLSFYDVSWRIEYSTGLKLLNYPDRRGKPGLRLLPEGAEAFPKVSSDGRTWTFKVRRGLRFSNGAEVTARAFERALVRALHPRMASPGQEFLRDVVGARLFFEGSAKTLPGVRVLGPYTLQIRTTKRAPDLPARLAMPFFAAVLPRTPLNPDGIEAPVHAAGPYYVAEWKRHTRILLRRNPHYGGNRLARPDAILFQIGPSLAAQRARIENNESDVGGFPQTEAAALTARHGLNRGRLFVHRTGGVRFVAMNELWGIFRGNPRLRRAVAHALDRPALVRAYGAYSGVAHDQLLTPGVPGFVNWDVYPLARPDLERARALAVGHMRGGVVRVLFTRLSFAPSATDVLRANLEALGLKVELVAYPRHGLPPNHDIRIQAWTPEYADPYNSVNRALTVPRELFFGSFEYLNAAWRSRLGRTASLDSDRLDAYARLERELLRDAAPVAPFMAISSRVFVSARVGCYLHHPVYGTDYAALCLS